MKKRFAGSFHRFRFHNKSTLRSPSGLAATRNAATSPHCIRTGKLDRIGPLYTDMDVIQSGVLLAIKRTDLGAGLQGYLLRPEDIRSEIIQVDNTIST